MSSSHQRGSCANEYIQVIGRMMYDEPIVVRVSAIASICICFICFIIFILFCFFVCTNTKQALALLQTRCLQHGIDVRWFKNTPPTPSFARHIYKYYIPFCKDAIAAAMAVGFVPYRIRTEGSTR